MILKIMWLFLLGMAVLAMFGKIRMPKRVAQFAAKCPHCGRFKIGSGPCGCAK